MSAQLGSQRPAVDATDDLHTSLNSLHLSHRPMSEKSHTLSYQEALAVLTEAQKWTQEQPYCLPLYILTAQRYMTLGYPDLVAGAAYKALLLADAVRDAGDEYHDQAIEALERVDLLRLYDRSTSVPEEARDGGDSGMPDEQRLKDIRALLESRYIPVIYQILIRSLLACGCYQTAHSYYLQATRLYPNEAKFEGILKEVSQHVSDHFEVAVDALITSEHSSPTTWPDASFVRREKYPWNNYEPDRTNDLSKLNALMNEVAPRLEVLAVELPDLTKPTPKNEKGTTRQLGVFAKEDIAPGEIVLNETSLLTANNKLQDALCDACSVDLPELASAKTNDTVSCPDCEIVFCSQSCYDKATELYHPALCGTDVEAIAKDVPPTQAADALYSLLLLRTLALAETQQVHPLALKEVKYIWGDFNTSTPESHWPNDGGIPRTLPFSFENNIRLPFHMLEKMDIDIFANPQYDVWVFNTLYAKFRGTASARLSGLGGRAIRGPEVSAVHPTWCLANHSCDPNVSWEWSGSIKLWAREERKACGDKDGNELNGRTGGIKKGEEVLNHYCDIDLPVQERREWAQGALGGLCRCARCLWESGEKSTSSRETKP